MQASELEYAPPDENYALYLEGEISDRLMRSMRRWRAKFGSTRFNKTVGRKLKTLLDDLEKARLGEVEVSEEMHAVTLREVMSSSDMYGHPLNMTFTEIDDVIQRVKNTDIHLMQRNNIQFAIAVGVFPYVCGVNSVWVYVAAISSRRF